MGHVSVLRRMSGVGGEWVVLGGEWVVLGGQGLGGVMSVCVVSMDYLCRWQVQVSVYCVKRIPAHLMGTHCSIMLRLTDICFMLHTVYLTVADIENPDFFAYGCRTWISLDIA